MVGWIKGVLVCADEYECARDELAMVCEELGVIRDGWRVAEIYDDGLIAQDAERRQCYFGECPLRTVTALHYA